MIAETDVQYRNALLSLVTDKGQPCLWCDSTDTGCIQQAACFYGEQPIDIWQCFGCGSRFGFWSRPIQIHYEDIARRHAWYTQLRRPHAGMVAGLLAAGPERRWACLAADHVNNLAWNRDRRYREFLHLIFAERNAGRQLRILEVSVGSGITGGIAAHIGHDYLGTDINADSIAEAEATFGRFGARFRHAAPDEIMADGQYDFVFNSDAIEHVNRPREFLHGLLAATTPGGTLIVTTPDLDLFRYHVWNTDLPPIHTVFLSRNAMESAIRQRMPGADIEIFNEDFGAVEAPDAEPPSRIALVTPAQIDPNNADFSYSVERQNSPNELPRGRGRASPPACSVGSSMIVVVKA